ncbi:bifunctional UDP-N-acetylglucosamine diphosphorylase/glucosamine-1-phosphate N-acetyltransferase GlmU [Paenibacillus yanchengensis]|uniref:Bifunctional protein GlmU n=1 Tax=Paenibacillus yanchengensis TaxID=2035833 RepID=A0ABW4YIA1_9BACL
MKKLAIVLAAGQGKRMKSKLYKVMHQICGKPMIEHVVDVTEAIDCERTVVVVGHGAEAIQAHLGNRVDYAMQAEQLGTGHAVLQAKQQLGAEEGITILLYGDTPLVRASTIETMIVTHQAEGAAATLLTVAFDDPTGYGRIIRGEDGTVEKIVEHKDCSEQEATVKEINTGTYIFDNQKLFAALAQVTNDNAQGEYYITDVISIMKQAGETVLAYRTADQAEAAGVNDRVALAEAEQLMRQRINQQHLLEGVTIIDPANTYIEADVTIGADTIVHPGSYLRKGTVIGSDCIIGPQTDITASIIGDQVHIQYSSVEESKVDAACSIGPYARLRPGTVLGARCKVGNFVELKNAVVATDSKISHLSYVGDAEVGKEVNIGCGAITVNYDGFNKQLTKIADHAFIGSNVNLIAPVHVGEAAYVVAGSTITHDVPAGDLAIAREKQVNKEGYADKIKARAKAKKERIQSSSDQ